MWPIATEREGNLIISDCEIFIQTARAEAGGWLLAGGGGCVVEVEDASNWCVSARAGNKPSRSLKFQNKGKGTY